MISPPREAIEWTASARGGEENYQDNRIFPTTLRSQRVSPLVELVRLGVPMRGTIGRWQLIRWPASRILNTTVFPNSRRNWRPELSVIDDRAAFEEKKRRQALALAQDQHAIDVLHSADKYDYSYLWSWMGVPTSNFLPT